MANLAGGHFQPGTAAVPCSKVEVSVSCRQLRDRDTFSKSDPMCVLFMKDTKSNSYYEVGRTEKLQDSLNPDFVHKFILDYYFEESQKLKFEIYDVDSPTARLTNHDFLGRMECTLGELVGCGGGKLERPLQGLVGGAGKVIVRAEEVSSSKEIATFQFRANNLDKKDFFGKSDPFLVFYRANEDKSFTVVHKTEVIKNTLSPTWAPFTIPVRALCAGDYNRTIKVECYDWDSDGTHDIIGEFLTNLRDLSKGTSGNNRYDVINPQKKGKKKGYKNSGECTILICKIETQPSFLDYIQGGTEMNFTVAIDFTASNGDPNLPSSLHYNHPHQMNQYATAIQAIGEIIQDYDTDKQFPVLGFGAMLPDGTVSHEFPCNFSPSNPYCQGIQGVMDAYYNSLRQVRLYGPTNFSPVINHVAKFASSIRDGSHYFVLLIITDGVITDMPHTIKAIVDASSLPMSIIIVGVGNDSFEAMEVLDADNQRLSSGGKFAERDIVQFVPLRNFLNGGRMGNVQASLAKEVLAEVPTQFLSYMQKHGVKPKPPRNGSQQPPMRPPIQGQATGGVPHRPPAPQQQWAGAPQQQQYGGAPPPGQVTGGIPSQPPAPQQQWAGPPQQQQYGGAPPLGQVTGGIPSQPPAPQQQWAGAPQQQQYGGAPPPGQVKGGIPSQTPAPQQQWAGAPQQQQYGGALPQGQATGGVVPHPPAPQQQWSGAPQQQQYGGAPPVGQATGGMPIQPPPPQQQWAGAPQQHYGGAPPPPQHQWGGAPPSYQPQWGGAPQQGMAPHQPSRATAPPPP